jgi:hypothetical protein
VSSPDASIRLDTGAFGAARRRRAGRAVAYWGLLLLGAAAVAGAIALVSMALQPEVVPATHAARAGGAAGAKAGATTTSAAPTSVADRAPERGRTDASAMVPPPRETPVVVWNGFGGQGAATALANRARAAGYPVVGVRDAPRRTYRATYVLFVPGREGAAKALATKLGLADAAVRPLDGLRPAAIRPAQLLVILAR